MAFEALNRLCKWRTVLAGWQAGTRSMQEPGTQALRDQMDKWLIMRAENSAIVQLLCDKGLTTYEDFNLRVNREALLLSNMLEMQFPGFRATDDGMRIDIAVASETMKRMGFPP